MRSTWDEAHMAMAEATATRSPDQKRQVGCVIVAADNRIISTGFNGTPPGFDDSNANWWDKEWKEAHVIHAEQNALMWANPLLLKDSKIYVTLSPCKNCLKMIAGSGISEVIYKNLSSALIFNPFNVRIRQL